MPSNGGKKGELIVTTSVRLPQWMDKMVEHEAAERSIGKSDVVQLALRKLFKLAPQEVR